jgi:hypothetical protein
VSEATDYQRLGAPLKAIQVTEESIETAASWISGKITSDPDRGERVSIPTGPSQQYRHAYPGDWIVRDTTAGNSPAGRRTVILVFSDEDFRANFRPLEPVAETPAPAVAPTPDPEVPDEDEIDETDLDRYDDEGDDDDDDLNDD